MKVVAEQRQVSIAVHRIGKIFLNFASSSQPVACARVPTVSVRKASGHAEHEVSE